MGSPDAYSALSVVSTAVTPSCEPEAAKAVAQNMKTESRNISVRKMDKVLRFICFTLSFFLALFEAAVL